MREWTFSLDSPVFVNLRIFFSLSGEKDRQQQGQQQETLKSTHLGGVAARTFG